MPDEDPVFDCAMCNHEGVEVEEFCENCGDGPLCINCKQYCEWSHSPAGQKDRADDQKLSEWKERNLI